MSVTLKAISINVEGGTLYTEDWGAFEVDGAKVKPEFEGIVVDLGTAISPEKVTAMFYPPFKGRKLKIQGVVTPELLANPDLYDSEGRLCLIVGKDGTKTGLTFGRYAGMVSFLCDELTVESIELGIYNWGKNTGVFSDKGDSVVSSANSTLGSRKAARPVPTSRTPPLAGGS